MLALLKLYLVLVDLSLAPRIFVDLRSTKLCALDMIWIDLWNSSLTQRYHHRLNAALINLLTRSSCKDSLKVHTASPANKSFGSMKYYSKRNSGNLTNVVQNGWLRSSYAWIRCLLDRKKNTESCKTQFISKVQKVQLHTNILTFPELLRWYAYMTVLLLGKTFDAWHNSTQK